MAGLQGVAARTIWMPGASISISGTPLARANPRRRQVPRPGTCRRDSHLLPASKLRAVRSCQPAAYRDIRIHRRHLRLGTTNAHRAIRRSPSPFCLFAWSGLVSSAQGVVVNNCAALGYVARGPSGRTGGLYRPVMAMLPNGNMLTIVATKGYGDQARSALTIRNMTESAITIGASQP